MTEMKPLMFAMYRQWTVSISDGYVVIWAVKTHSYIQYFYNFHVLLHNMFFKMHGDSHVVTETD